MTAADLVLTGGKILTLDRHSRIVPALAVRGGRIAALGRDSEIASLIGPDTRRLDLRGRLAVPGLIDGHAHMDREGMKMAEAQLKFRVGEELLKHEFSRVMDAIHEDK